MKHHDSVRTTDAQIDAAISSARGLKSGARAKIKSAYYDRARDVVVIELTTKATIEMPRSILPGFTAVNRADLGDLCVQKSGLSIWSETADVGLRLERLFGLVSGSASTSIAASVLGKKRSGAKAIPSRTNGAKGGRSRAKENLTLAKK